MKLSQGRHSDKTRSNGKKNSQPPKTHLLAALLGALEPAHSRLFPLHCCNCPPFLLKHSASLQTYCQICRD